ncbi:MAG: methyltransferase domain-containing protein [Clostridiales bacterium]|nr:methyltransferase domain-containing protein [Clostridiales bacterium]
MVKPRIPETDEGIQDAITVEIFDSFARGMRDRGMNNVKTFLKEGIGGANILEIGPGPGYIGLELLGALPDSMLTGCEISPEMVKIARKNAKDYGFDKRARYVEGNCMQMPFDDVSFDAVFSNGSMHEWEDPVLVFNEIHRVLKPGGVFCVCDMRRDVSAVMIGLAYTLCKPKEIRPGFLTSLHAAYTAEEMREMLDCSALQYGAVKKDVFGLTVSGKKPAQRVSACP